MEKIMALVPQDPIYSPFAPFLTGLGLTWLSNTTLSVAVGNATDGTNNNVIPVSTAVTINAAANGVAGLDTGALANNTVYYIFAIASSPWLNSQDSSGNYPDNALVPSALLSASASAPVLPFGYDMKRRIGAVLTDGSAHILKFEQTLAANQSNRKMWFDAPIAVLTGGASATYADVSLAAYIPAAVTEVTLNASITPNSAGNSLFLQAKGASGDQVVVNGVVVSVAQKLQVVVGTNATPTISYKVSNASDAASLLLAAYVDQL